MDGKGSRRKGKVGEREVLTVLRMHLGGHWERRHAGDPGPDIIPPADFPYAVEVKNVSTVRLKHFWHPTKQLEDFWLQTKRQADELHQFPLLVCKVEGMWFVHTPGTPGIGWQLLDNWALDYATRRRAIEVN